MKVMVMAGTSDARRIIQGLSSLGVKYILATATTKHGGELAKNSGADEVITGRFNGLKLAEIIRAYDIEVLIDATHPFASDATRNAVQAADVDGVDYIRFERPSLDLPESELIHRVNSFQEAVEEIQEIITDGDRVFHLAGVMTLHYITKQVSPQQVVARILPSKFSLKKCLESGIPPENIIAMEGIFSKEFNKALMWEYNIRAVVTKESGEVGGTPSKIEAALELNIPVVMVMRPKVRELEDKKVFNDPEELIREFTEK